MTSRLLLSALFVLGLTGCEINLWGDGTFGHIDPDDPDARIINEDDNEDTPEAQDMGWAWSSQGSEVPDLDGNGWSPQTHWIWVIPVGDQGDRTWTFDWDWGGSYVPLITTSKGDTFFSTKIHVCENTHAILTIEDSDGKSVQIQRINSARNDEACEALCDGAIENCPFDGTTPKAPPPNACDLQWSGAGSGNACLEKCASDMVACVERNDCDSTPCESSFFSCTDRCS